MNTVESNRKSWNRKQAEFRRVVSGFEQHDLAIELFLEQHAMLHSARMSRAGLWSYEDEILEEMAEEQARRIPANCEHSVAWCLWHIARIEDVTMNILVGGKPQIFLEGKWREKMNVEFQDTGNAMHADEVRELSNRMDLGALRAYRLAVGRRTRKIVQKLKLEDLKRKVDSSRLNLVRRDGAVTDAANGILDYWGNLTIAGLLLMPPTRHCFIHLNEAYKLKNRRSSP